jgi:pyrimidine-nucleoside phosphorylase
MDMQSIIATRRDAKRHTDADLIALANGAAKGTIPDYQLAAWLMAAYLNPLNEQETAWLTMAMADSGERLDLTGIPKPWVDKHSTGGVGDKTSIVVIPLLASCGLTVVKMSGRGLGITGGTVDKLGSIPGFRLDLSPEEMKAQAARIGLALTGQTPDLAPADKVLYALRDVTSTVSSIPLIVSSILSKKLAGGAETIVLDVKCGSGAFMPNLDAARELAHALRQTATLCGLNIRIAITDMDQPLGSAVGNALEVREALRVLNGEQSRFSHLCIELVALTLEACGIQSDRPSARRAANEAISSGAAKLKAQEWFSAQGATVDVFDHPEAMGESPIVKPMIYDGASGWVSHIAAQTIGQAVVDLGGGRKTKNDVIDHTVGLELGVEVGAKIVPGQAILSVHARTEQEADEAIARLTTAITIVETETSYREPILAIV